MPLSIKNDRAEKLARTLSRETGESITRVIVVALEERLERLKGRRRPPSLADEILAISKRCRALPDLDRRTAHDLLREQTLSRDS